MVEGARLESEYTAKPYRGFEYLPLRHFCLCLRSGIVPMVDCGNVPILHHMIAEEHRQSRDTLAEVEEEIRRGRKFSPTEAMGRMAGPGAMKGASPVSRQQQAEIELGNWIRANVADPAGALQAVLHRQVRGSQELLRNLDCPLAGLAELCEQLLKSDYRLSELVREADVEWGERMDELPRFERQGFPPRADDPYTVAWVKAALRGIVADIKEMST